MKDNKKDWKQSGWRRDFPFFTQNPQIVYFDSAATTQKPACVLDALYQYYAAENASIGRSSYHLARNAEAYDQNARACTANFIGAKETEIIFTKSATEAANIIAHSYAMQQLHANKNIVVTGLEHNSNLLPWMECCKRTGAELRIATLDAHGFVDLEDFTQKLDTNTILAAITCSSNFLHGEIAYEAMTKICKEKNICVVLDATQYIAHERIDVKKIPCDFMFFSGHKMFATMGSGVLYAKEERLDQMQPFLVGGGMILGNDVTAYAEGAGKFEAGTQDVAARITLEKAITYRMQQEAEKSAYEKQLCQKLISGLLQLQQKGIHILGDTSIGIPTVSFTCDFAHPYDIAMLLNAYHIAVRSGQLCAQQAFKQLGLDGCVRVSLSIYNTEAEITYFLESLEAVLKRLQRKNGDRT